MRLVHFTADGLKSLQGVELELGDLTALYGPTGSGKSSILQGITLGILGHDPAIGKTLAATRQLAGGKGAIEVGLTFDTGFSVRRRFAASTETEVYPPRGEAVEKSKQERIDQETGAFLMSFDLGSYLGLSAEKRRAALFGILPRELAHLDIEVYRHWLGYAEAEDAIKRGIDKLWRDQLETVQTPVEGLASAIEFARARYLEADRERQAQEKVSAQAAREAADAARNRGVAADTDQLHRLQMDLSSIEQRIGQLRERRDQVERAERRARERDERIQFARGRIERGETLIRQLTADRDALEVPSPQTLQLAREAVLTAEGMQRDRREALAVARSQLGTARQDLALHQEELRTLESYDACPTCGSVADLSAAKERTRELVQAQEASVAHLEGATRTLEGELAEVSAELDRVTEESGRLIAIAERSRKLTFDIGQAEALLRGVREELKRLEDDAVGAPEGDLQEISTEMRALEDEAAGIRTSIAEIQGRAQASGRAQAAQERADEQRKKLKTLETRTAALGGIYRGLQKLRAHVIQQMVRPVEQVANELLQSIDPAKRFAFLFEREGKDDFDLGFVEDGVFRSYDAASTGEDALLAVVFVAAMIAAVAPPWPVLLIDNVETIDSERRRALMEALARVRDRFGNIIVAGCSEIAPVEGWNIIDVRELRPALEEVA